MSSAANSNGGAAMAGSGSDPVLLASTFVQRDDDVKRFTQEMRPVRKQRQDLYKHLLQLMEQEEDPSRQVIAVPEGGAVLRLKAVESAAPIKTDFLSAQLSQILSITPEQAEDVARRVDEARPRVVRYRIVREKDGVSATQAATETGGSRKRGRGAASGRS